MLYFLKTSLPSHTHGFALLSHHLSTFSTYWASFNMEKGGNTASFCSFALPFLPTNKYEKYIRNPAAHFDVSAYADLLMLGPTKYSNI